MDRKEYLNEKEVSERIGIGVRTLQRWRLESQGPPFRKIGGSVRYAVTDLCAYLDARPRGGERTGAAA
jgi:hypothetical protein